MICRRLTVEARPNPQPKTEEIAKSVQNGESQGIKSIISDDSLVIRQVILGFSPLAVLRRPDVIRRSGLNTRI